MKQSGLRGLLVALAVAIALVAGCTGPGASGAASQAPASAAPASAAPVASGGYGY
jgi:hypothetical protein